MNMESSNSDLKSSENDFIVKDRRAGTHSEESPNTLSALEEDILTVLLSRTLYGLQICKAIEQASGGKQSLKIGSLYPSLHRLEKKGYVQSYIEQNPSNSQARGGNRKKYYKITGIGAGVLSQRQEMRRNLANWSPGFA